MLIRKFFDTGADGAGAGGDQGGQDNFFEGLKPGDRVDLSGMLEGDESASDDDDEETGSEGTPPGADAGAGGSDNGGTPKQGQPGSEGTGQGGQQAPPNTPGTEAGAQQPPADDLATVLSGKDKTSVLTALGYDPRRISALEGLDDFELGLIEARRKNGNLNSYFQASATDFDKVPDAELLREELRSQYPTLSEGAFQKLYEKEVTSKYSLDELAAPEDKELGEVQMKRRADEIRAAKKAEAQKLLDPGRTPEAEAQRLKAEAEQNKKIADYEAFTQEVKTDPVTKSLFESKRLAILGDLKIDVSPEKLEAAALDTNLLFSGLVDENGKINLAEFYELAAFRQNPKGFKEALFNAGKSAAEAQNLREHVNPDTRTVAQGGTPKEETVGGALSKRGKHTTMGEILND